MEKTTDSVQTHTAAACLLLSIAEADEILEDSELQIVGDILQEFFKIEKDIAGKLVQDAQVELKNATDLFQFGKQLNREFNQDDKLDFISCIFEVAYADGELHYLEHHTIKKIANILHINRAELITANAEIKAFLE